MFKDYWNKNKHLIQLVGILTGVGALFLSIVPPENLDARQSLANVQLVWLIIITIGCSILFLSFHNFSVDLENHYGPKWSINMKETISLIIALSLVYLLTNLWAYITKLYSASLWDFLKSINIGIIAILGAVFFHFFWKYVEKINRLHYKVVFVMGAYIFFSGVTAFTGLFIGSQGITFTFINWIITAGVLLLLMILATAYKELRHWKRRRDQGVNTNNIE